VMHADSESIAGNAPQALCCVTGSFVRRQRRRRRTSKTARTRAATANGGLWQSRALTAKPRSPTSEAVVWAPSAHIPFTSRLTSRRGATS
jgi:hypothetical protein